MSKKVKWSIFALFLLINLTGCTVEGQGQIVEPVWITFQYVSWETEYSGTQYKNLIEIGTNWEPAPPQVDLKYNVLGEPRFYYGYHIRGIGAKGYYFLEVDTYEAWIGLKDQVGTCHLFDWFETSYARDGSLKQIAPNSIVPIPCKEIGMSELDK